MPDLSCLPTDLAEAVRQAFAQSDALEALMRMLEAIERDLERDPE